jgi:Potential Monad-binding region of RPAP3
MLNISATNKDKYTIKVVDDFSASEPTKKEEIKPEKSKSEETTDTSEFIKLKKIDGPVVHHNRAQDSVQEDSNQKVHFNINKNEEFTESTIPKNKNYAPSAKPKKSAIKNSPTKDSSGESPTVKVAPAKKVDVAEIGKKIIEQTILASDSETPVNDSTEFNNIWRHIKQNAELAEKFFMTRAQPENFAKIFKQGVEFDLFMEFVDFAHLIIEK